MDDLGASHDFRDFTFNAMIPFTFDRDTLAIRVEGAHTFGARPVERSLAIGGFTSVSGYAPNSLIASDYSLSQILAWRRFSELTNPLFNFSFFIGGTFELTNIRNDNSNVGDAGLISSGSIIVGGDTPLLPVHIGIGVADTGEQAVYFSIGRLGRSTGNY